MNCVADALFLAIRNYHIELLTKNKTDVDATGRYILIPLLCADGCYSHHAHLNGYLYKLLRGCHSVCLQPMAVVGHE